MLKIYYNPDCSKCKSAIELLDENGERYEAVNYLLNPPSPAELKGLLDYLGIEAEQLVRKKKPLYLEKFEGKFYTQEEWLLILSTNPVLIERPIVVKDSKAIIGRPVERIIELF